MNLLGTGPTDHPSATTLTQSQRIALARLLEDLSASAFAAATIYLTGTNLALATQALASDGLHAGLIRLISIQTNTQYQGTQYASYSTSNTSQTNLAFSASTTSGSNLIYAFLPTPVTVTTGNPPNIPAVGNVLTGIGIPPGAGAVITGVTYVASATPTAITIKSTNVLTNVSSIANLVVGQPITGTNVPAGAYITAISTSNNTITISAAASGSTTVAPTGYVTNLSSTITGVSSVSGLLVGQVITGTGIQPNTTISTFNTSAATITLSAAATATSVATTTGVLTNGSATIAQLSGVSGFVTGASITGTFIPANTTILGATSSTITMSAAATGSTPVTTNTSFTGYVTNGSATVTGLSSTANLAVGQLLVGTGPLTRRLNPRCTAVLCLKPNDFSHVSMSTHFQRLIHRTGGCGRLLNIAHSQSLRLPCEPL